MQRLRELVTTEGAALFDVEVRDVLEKGRSSGCVMRTASPVARDLWDERVGHAQAIRIDPVTGMRYGGADPRGDGLAVGY